MLPAVGYVPPDRPAQEDGVPPIRGGQDTHPAGPLRIPGVSDISNRPITSSASAIPTGSPGSRSACCDRFDLVLRPNDKLARDSLAMYEIWDDVIVKPGIEAECELPATKPDS